MQQMQIFRIFKIAINDRNDMIEKIKNNWLIILINLLILSLYIVTIGFTHLILIVEAAFLLGFYFKILRNSTSSTVTTKEGMLLVKGVFHNLRMEQKLVSEVKFKRNLLANIFDWDLMIIKTQLTSVHIYVRRSYKTS